MLRTGLSSHHKTPENDTIVAYIGALAVLWCHVKLLNRLILYSSDKERYSVELSREMSAGECENWNPLNNPEWILVELELDITIRPVQIQVARHMMKMPEGIKNGVMQLNMGEGKTSVIVPMIVAALTSGRSSTDKKKMLCRVTVLNSIFATNTNLLSFAIGGFLNRRIYTIPCRRDLKIGMYLDEIQSSYETCRQLGGVVITLPEYRLSFRLQMYNKYLREKHDMAFKIYQTEAWLRKYARDIVDESDEIFSVKYQLIYTTGLQLQVDGGRMRWTVAQKLLEFLPLVASRLFEIYGQDIIEFQPEMRTRNPEQFPHFRILSDNCKTDFYELVADGILDGQVDLLGGILREEERKVVREFLINENILEDDHEKLFEIDGISKEKKEILLLISGYLRRGIFVAAFKKRWRVECGVKTQNDGSPAKLMAVPFRAKDVAAERTEFGHPDMAIVLTQISYYYSGLSDDQLIQCFQLLNTVIPGPEGVYNSWIKKIPAEKITSDTIKSYKGINLQDYDQRTEHLFPVLRKHKAVVDFWLENVAFPKECKQFPGKLVTNAWDLCYERCTHPATGFSGTNDTSLLLPAQITQQDLKILEETNVKMEDTLKRDENGWKRSLKMGVSCKEILKFMIKDGLRVLIDAGALMLELGNEEIAELWLALDQRLEAVVYFDDENNLLIKSRRHGYQRNAKQQMDPPLNLSSFRDRLECCAIYLDDQHTRGTDVRLPTDFKACVTLGSGMRRDKLIQACMRMRKLGQGQSVNFYLSHEVHNKIMLQKGELEDISSQISVNDVLTWVKSNSRHFEEEGLVYWTTNARNYTQKLLADDLFEMSEKTKGDGSALGEHCEDPDVQTLQVMYGTFHHRVLLTSLIPKWFQQIKTKLGLERSKNLYQGIKLNKTLHDIEKEVMAKCEENIPKKTFFHSMLDEEQEKELEPEQEEEVQVQRPSKETPLTPNLHINVVSCVTQGQSPVEMEGITPLCSLFKDTSIGSQRQPKGWGNNWYASDDFINVINYTVQHIRRKNYVDSFLRPIRYFVSFKNKESPDATSVLILSQFEVNKFIVHFRHQVISGRATLHMFTGRWMEGQDIFANNHRLQLPITGDEGCQLGVNIQSPLLIAAGNLFYNSLEEQKAFAHFLGLRLRPWEDEEVTKDAFDKGLISSTGFVSPDCPWLRESCQFQEDPTEKVRGILRFRNEVLRDTDHITLILDRCAFLLEK